MKRKMRRKFIKIIGFSFFSLIFQPVAFLYSQTKKLINPNLSDKQKSIMFKEATERPFSSPLNNEKDRVIIIVPIVEQNFFHQVLNLIAVQVGHRSQSLCLEPLKLK